MQQQHERDDRQYEARGDDAGPDDAHLFLTQVMTEEQD